MTESSAFGETREEIRIAADATAPARARSMITEVLEGQPVDDAARARVLTVASELVNNAVVHGSREGDEVHVSCRIVGRCVKIRVSDAARGPSVPAVNSPDARRSSGRGLHVVEQYADWSERIVDGRREVEAEIPL